ncbi:uncharacterized protein LOC108905293 [Anoplophora glabripennis]|uniref:uncharacterized protein LOC108905293 n=1 Tax=Anoplophora glabripennis TaxID=217634 RepID=UPI000875A47B|nr:uncharacterized protein LOC108905293 [Anoplophora glabripennis]
MSNFSNFSDHSANWSSQYRRLKFSHLYWSSNIGDGYFTKPNNSQWGPVIIIPLLATIILAASVFLLVIFRQNPTFVITTIAGCLIFITIYLTICAMETTKEVLE